MQGQSFYIISFKFKMQIKPATLTDILELRSKFQPISDISFAFSKLNKTYPLDFITEEQAVELIKAYKKLLEKLKEL